VTGLDAILGGHTHDGIPKPVEVKNRSGVTLVTNAGSNGKFLGVLDFEVKGGRVAGYQYKLMPVFSNLLAADKDMTALMQMHRVPFEAKLSEKLATTDGLLYRRGNFNGSFDQLILDALMKEKDAPIAFSPGFRWGTSLLPGSAITMEDVLNQTAITYPTTTVNNMTGAQIKTVLEDVGDNLFNPDPYYQQGGDMVRVGGLEYTCEPGAAMGSRIQDMRLDGKLIEADKVYKVAGWAPVSEAARDKGGEPIWDLVARHLRSEKVVKVTPPNMPKLKGMAGNLGMI
jgi:sulfur-oxidizing protein SoxB